MHHTVISSTPLRGSIYESSMTISFFIEAGTNIVEGPYTDPKKRVILALFKYIHV